MKTQELHDKVVVVIGGSGGIGAAVCSQMAEAGARVALSYRSNEQAALAILRDLPGDGQRFSIRLDFTFPFSGLRHLLIWRCGYCLEVEWVVCCCQNRDEICHCQSFQTPIATKHCAAGSEDVSVAVVSEKCVSESHC